MYGEPYLLYAGVHVFFCGAVTAFFGALLMVGAGFVNSPSNAKLPIYPLPS